MCKLCGLHGCPPWALPAPRGELHEASPLPDGTGTVMSSRRTHSWGPTSPEQSLGPHTVRREAREEPRRRIHNPARRPLDLPAELTVGQGHFPATATAPLGSRPLPLTPAARRGPWGLGQPAPSDLPPILLPCAMLLLLRGSLQTWGGRELHCKPGSQSQRPPHTPPHGLLPSTRHPLQ